MVCERGRVLRARMHVRVMPELMRPPPSESCCAKSCEQPQCQALRLLSSTCGGGRNCRTRATRRCTLLGPDDSEDAANGQLRMDVQHDVAERAGEYGWWAALILPVRAPARARGVAPCSRARYRAGAVPIGRRAGGCRMRCA